MTAHKRLSIIVPSYNDSRIERAIQSIKRFDDTQSVKIVVIDGGSPSELKQSITASLSSSDTFVSEPDKGVLDALNKGLDVCDTEFIGWLGSDDMFTGNVLASQVIALLAEYDLLVANLEFFRNGYITRVHHALPSRLGLTKFGLHNPHFATFGSASLLKSERFKIGLRGSDIEYFIRIFNRKPRVTSLSVTAVLQEEGGFSNSSIADILRTNLELISIYAHYTNWLLGPMAVMIKLSYKFSSKAYRWVFREQIQV